MTGSTRTTADLDPRRARAVFRAWHRGIREMDLILGSFADAEVPDMSLAELEDFERLMELSDLDLFKWITGASERPDIPETAMLDRVIAHRATMTFG